MTSTNPTAAPTTRTYDIIGFGDEVPGVLALVSASREFQRRTQRKPRSLLMFKGNSRLGIGGHLVRGGLAYLDRSNVPPDVRQAYGLPTFGDPCFLYKEFLQRSQVQQIALNPVKADAALRAMLQEADVDIVSQLEIRAVLKDGARIRGIQTNRGEIYLAKHFIDSTVNGELAQLAGVSKLRGFETFGLPESELPVTLVFETEGLTPQRLKEVELSYLKRFANPADTAAQNFILMSAGKNERVAEQFRLEMQESLSKSRLMHIGQDFIDVRSRALSIAFHAFRGRALTLKGSGFILDQANIAVLAPNRLSWNALMFFTTGSQAEALARGSARPTPTMLEEIKYLDRWFKSLGATAVRAYPELYIRHAGNITDVVSPLSGAQMLRGGVSVGEALGTFGYHLDVRGGIDGLGPRALGKGISSISFHHPPLFNIGMQHALVQSVPNLAVVSPGSGFEGYACAAGRIIEFNAAVGQGLGIAAAIALQTGRTLASISNLEVRRVLEQTKQLSKIYGRAEPVEAARLAKFEDTLNDVAIA
ncbi:MAG: FAD-dependent oxidoreductase [Leptolyngbyaceae cyanobacterium bins.302]|nr:FAD-dependent oxidoreductase [Leptolyngbyaceae cyanobacterium bins.302]